MVLFDAASCGSEPQLTICCIATSHKFETFASQGLGKGDLKGEIHANARTDWEYLPFWAFEISLQTVEFAM